MNEQIQKILVENYGLSFSSMSIEPYGTGHIHETFKISLDNNRCYILQEFNVNVFPEIDLVHGNLERIIRYLEKIKGDLPASTVIILPIPALDGKSYSASKEVYWRLFDFIPDSVTYNKPPTVKTSFEAGKKFGEFLLILSDLPVNEIRSPIPDFHQMSGRLDEFSIALSETDQKRKRDAAKEIETVLSRKAEMIELQIIMESGELPLRITHNDTKLNNILYDNEDRALAVIDLDTVMPGIVHFDYGDAIRTIANAGNEDSEDIAEVIFSETHFSAFTIGFLEKTARLLTRKEKETLFLAPMTMTFMMGLRFLTDYFNGDRYFKTGKPNHNLIRARAQFKFLEELDRNHEFIVNLIEQNAF